MLDTSVFGRRPRYVVPSTEQAERLYLVRQQTALLIDDLEAELLVDDLTEERAAKLVRVIDRLNLRRERLAYAVATLLTGSI